MKLKVIALISSLIIFAAAAQARGVSTHTVTVKLGKQVTLDHGLLKIKFLSVVEDSRCPMNARCIWAGRAKVKLSVKKGNSKPHVIELSSDEQAKEAGFYGYSFRLEDLKPHKGDPDAKPTGETVATLSVICYR